MCEEVAGNHRGALVRFAELLGGDSSDGVAHERDPDLDLAGDGSDGLVAVRPHARDTVDVDAAGNRSGKLDAPLQPVSVAVERGDLDPLEGVGSEDALHDAGELLSKSRPTAAHADTALVAVREERADDAGALGKLRLKGVRIEDVPQRHRVAVEAVSE